MTNASEVAPSELRFRIILLPKLFLEKSIYPNKKLYLWLKLEVI